jgi:hypothetical protein
MSEDPMEKYLRGGDALGALGYLNAELRRRANDLLWSFEDRERDRQAADQLQAEMVALAKKYETFFAP